MLTYILKPYTDKIFSPLIRYLNSKKIKSNSLTILSFIFSIIALINFFKGNLLLGLIFAIFDFLFDLLDGPLSRLEKNSNKNFGFYFDFTTDHITRNLWVFALAYSNNISYFVASLSILSYFTLLNISFIPHLTNMKHLNKLPSWMGWLILFGLAFNNLELFLYLMIFINFLFAIIQFSYIIYSYRKELF